MINLKFWKNKKILITGHTGFKGRWLTILLKLVGSKVYGISLKENGSSKFKEYINFLDKKNSYLLDIKKRKDIEKIILKINPEIIIHMAAQSKVIDGFIYPVKTFETNILGTINILNASIKLSNLKTVLIISSDKVYENIKYKKVFSENDKLGGDDPYSASKAAAEILLNYYRKFYPKIKIISVRAGNIIGGGDWGGNRIVSDLVKAWYYRKELIIRNPESTRPWQYVIDVLVFYLKIIEKSYYLKKMPLVFNIGPVSSSNNLTVLNLVSKFKYYFTNLKLIIKNDNKILEKKHIYLNTNRSIKFLKIKNNIRLEERIKRTVNIYKKIIRNGNIQKIYKEEILNFLSK